MMWIEMMLITIKLKCKNHMLRKALASLLLIHRHHLPSDAWLANLAELYI